MFDCLLVNLEELLEMKRKDMDFHVAFGFYLKESETGIVVRNNQTIFILFLTGMICDEFNELLVWLNLKGVALKIKIGKTELFSDID